MDQLQPKDITLDPESLEVVSFATDPQFTFTTAARLAGPLDCTGCDSGCGIDPT